MAKKPLMILRERAEKQSPDSLIAAMDARIGEINKAKELLVPMADIKTFTTLLSEVQETRAGQTEVLQSILESFNGISKAFAKSSMDSNKTAKSMANINHKATADAVASGIADSLRAGQADLQLAIANSEKTNKTLVMALTTLLQAIAKNAEPPPMPTIVAEVTERDTSDRIKKFEMREVRG